ncbi:unnamed protein product, partial [Ixodes pacificus]
KNPARPTLAPTPGKPTTEVLNSLRGLRFWQLVCKPCTQGALAIDRFARQQLSAAPRRPASRRPLQDYRSSPSSTATSTLDPRPQAPFKPSSPFLLKIHPCNTISSSLDVAPWAFTVWATCVFPLPGLS